MHHGLATWLAPFVFTVAAGAQGQVGLSFVSGPTNSNAFSNASLGYGIHDIHQITMIPHPNNTPGLFLGGMTVEGLPLNLGGRGLMDVVAFVYDRNTDTVSMNANAVVFNASGDDFSLSWGLDGTYAIAERLHGRSAGIYQAMAQGGPGGQVGPLVPIAGSEGTHPVASRIGGVNVLFYVSLTGGIVWRQHDVANAALVGPTFQVSPHQGGAFVHSPGPVVGADGDAHALLGCVSKQAGASDWNWQGDLDPTTAPIVQQPTPVAFENNGCEAGGRIYMPQLIGSTYTLLEYDVVGMLGDSVSAAGGPVDLTAFAPTKTSGIPDATIFVLGVAFLATPFPIPGTGNAFGLDPAPGLVVLGGALHSNDTGRGVFSFQMPPLGLGTIPVQGFTILGSGPYHLTSTAVITIVP